MIPHRNIVNDIARYEITIGLFIKAAFNSGFFTPLGRADSCLPKIINRIVFIFINVYHLHKHLKLGVVKLAAFS